MIYWSKYPELIPKNETYRPKNLSELVDYEQKMPLAVMVDYRYFAALLGNNAIKWV